MRDQLTAFFIALMFLTRIPCPRGIGHASDSLPKSTVYFPVVGLLVGGLGAIVYRLAAFGYTLPLAALCGIAATVFVVVNLLYLARRAELLRLRLFSLQRWMTTHVVTFIATYMLRTISVS